jgi:hypothetical protein
MGRRHEDKWYKSSFENMIEHGLLENDKRILELAMALGRFSSNQAVEYFTRNRRRGSSRASIERSLKRLVDLKLLARYRPLMNAGEGTHPYVYQVTKRGVEVIQRLYATDRPITHDYSVPKGRTVQLNHGLAVGQAVLRLIADDKRVRESLRLGFDFSHASIGANAVEKVYLWDERRDNSDDEWMLLRPDAYVESKPMILTSDILDDYEFPLSDAMYLEIDMGTEKLMQVVRQIKQYVGAYAAFQWEENRAESPIVCWVFKKEKRFLQVLDSMYQINRADFVEAKVKTNKQYSGIEPLMLVDDYYVYATTEDMFYRSGSVLSDPIWYTESDRGAVSLLEVFHSRRSKICENELHNEKKHAESLERQQNRLEAIERARNADTYV